MGERTDETASREAIVLLLDERHRIHGISDPRTGDYSTSLWLGCRTADLFDPDPAAATAPVEVELRGNALGAGRYRASLRRLRGPGGRASLLVLDPVQPDAGSAPSAGARMRAMLDELPVLVHAVDRDGRCVAWNRECARVTGFSADEVLGRPLAAVPAGGVWTPTATDGSPRRIAWCALGARLPVEGWADWGIGLDRTPVAGDPGHARDPDDLLETILREFPVVLWRVDPDGVFRESRGAGLARLGLREHQALGRNAFEDYPEAADAIARAIAGESLNLVLGGEGRPGPWWYHTFMAPDRGSGGMIGFSFDVTDRVRLERRLLDARKMEALGMLAGGIAHDFNNLMQVVSGYASLLRESPHVGEEEGPVVAQILRAADRAAALTRQLLAFSRRQSLEAREVDLNRVLADLGEVLRLLVGDSIRLRIVPAAEGAWVRLDPGQLEQVLVNLVANARDAMPDGGRVRVRVRRAVAPARPDGPPGARRVVQLDVRDTGTGMDADTLEHAFEPFFTTRRREGGTGLGLATVYGIVQQSGGDVRIASRPGRGTRVRIEVPEVSPTGDVPPEPVAGPAASGGAETILVAEDDEQVREFVALGLRQAGYTVHTARHGRDALEVLGRAGPVDLVISDVVMPVLGGLELEEELRDRPGAPRLLLMSGYVDTDELRSGRAREVLVKPFTVPELLRRVREMLDAAAPAD